MSEQDTANKINYKDPLAELAINLRNLDDKFMSLNRSYTMYNEVRNDWLELRKSTLELYEKTLRCQEVNK